MAQGKVCPACNKINGSDAQVCSCGEDLSKIQTQSAGEQYCMFGIMPVSLDIEPLKKSSVGENARPYGAVGSDATLPDADEGRVDERTDEPMVLKGFAVKKPWER